MIFRKLWAILSIILHVNNKILPDSLTGTPSSEIAEAIIGNVNHLSKTASSPYSCKYNQSVVLKP
jgi:hypothetical protein